MVAWQAVTRTAAATVKPHVWPERRLSLLLQNELSSLHIYSSKKSRADSKAALLVPDIQGFASQEVCATVALMVPEPSSGTSGHSALAGKFQLQC